MSVLTVTGATALRMDQFEVGELDDGTVTSATSTQFVVQTTDNYRYTFSGENFTYGAGGTVTGGTLAGIEERFGGAQTFNVTGFRTDAAAFYNFVQNNNTTAAYNALFSGNDDLTGNAGNDYLIGLGGADNLFGGAGSDTLDGGEGNDHLYGLSASAGADGADRLLGGAGADYLQGNAGNDTLDGGDGSDRIQGGADNDLITGAAGNDTVNGNQGDDTIDGGVGNDSLRGGQGNDSIAGGADNDTLRGDIGTDTLSGGAGYDVLEGGADADRFVWSGTDAAIGPNDVTDVVADWQNGTDRLALGFTVTSVLQIGTASTFANARMVAQNAIDGNPGGGEVAAVNIGTDTYLFWSTSNSTVDSAVKLNGVPASQFDLTDFG